MTSVTVRRRSRRKVTAARHAGKAAALEFKPITANPHGETHPSQRDAWLEGYTYGATLIEEPPALEL